MDKSMKIRQETKEVLRAKKAELRLESLDAAIMWYVSIVKKQEAKAKALTDIMK